MTILPRLACWCRGIAILVLLVVTLAQNRPAAQTVQRTSRSTEALRFSSVDDVPAERTLLSDTEREAWYFIPSWSGRQSASDSQRGRREGSYRERSPFVVLDKRSKGWRSVAISRRVFEIYPVRQDTEEKSLIWFGANDAPRGSIIDWIANFWTTGDVDDALVFSGAPGGLGLIDTAKRTVTYFGKYRDLVGGRVNDFLFEKDAVWVPARPNGTLELRGLARFDRRSRTFEPFPIESHGYGDGWRILTFTGSDTTVSLSVLEWDDWFNRYQFDKASRTWRQLRYGWVAANDTVLFAEPNEQSTEIEVLQPNSHFGKQGHDHYGHPVVIQEEQNGWQRVITCRDVTGWTRSGVLVDTLEYVRRTVNDPATLRDRGNEGPRMFVWQARFYMPPDDRKLVDLVENSQLAAAVSKGKLDPQEHAAALRFLEIRKIRDTQLETARLLWDEFAKRRRSLNGR